MRHLQISSPNQNQNKDKTQNKAKNKTPKKKRKREEKIVPTKVSMKIYAVKDFNMKSEKNTNKKEKSNAAQTDFMLAQIRLTF